MILVNVLLARISKELSFLESFDLFLLAVLCGGVGTLYEPSNLFNLFPYLNRIYFFLKEKKKLKNKYI
jgi:hypothetical protein